MPEMDGKGLLEELQKNQPAPYAIVLTAFGSIETALETVHKLGAFWYLEKPVQTAALQMILERAIEKRRLATHAGRLERELASRGVLGELVGDSPAMREIFYLVQQAAPTKATILITGESGVGQRTGGARDPSVEPAERRAVFCRQLRGHARNADGERIVRPRKRSVHGRSGAPAGVLRTGQRRHAAAGRNRRHAAEYPGKAAARTRGAARTPARVAAGNRARCPRPRFHQPGSARGHLEGNLSRGSLFPAQRFRNSSAAAARADSRIFRGSPPRC